MGPVTSHSCCSREKPVPRHACIAMTDCFPQNITQINPFSTLSGFCRNPVSNEEGKWYKATHFALLASNWCMKVDLLPQPPKPMGLQHMCLLLAKIMTLFPIFSIVWACCVCVCAVVAINPRLHSSHLLSYIFNCVCMFVYLYVCLCTVTEINQGLRACRAHMLPLSYISSSGVFLNHITRTTYTKKVFNDYLLSGKWSKESIGKRYKVKTYLRAQWSLHLKKIIYPVFKTT